MTSTVILNTISSPLAWGKNPQSQDKCLCQKKKMCGKGAGVDFTKNTLNELSKYYTNADTWTSLVTAAVTL